MEGTLYLDAFSYLSPTMTLSIDIASNAQELGLHAGTLAVHTIQHAIDKNGAANIILATGSSQFETLKYLVNQDIDWERVHMFHLDEYIGIDESHPASFRKYLKGRFLAPIDYACKYYLIDGMQDPDLECNRLNDLIRQYPIDVALIGIGENGHLAFNDPPANFETKEPYIQVALDEACRLQQVGEGWFSGLEAVPSSAISMSIQQILASTTLIVSVPDERKAKAVQGALQGPVTNTCPASILQEHPNCHLFLDRASASLL